MGNQICNDNCKDFNKNEKVLYNIASKLKENYIEDEEIYEKVKSSKQGNFDEKCIFIYIKLRLLIKINKICM